MDLDALTTAPSEKTVQEYVEFVKGIDWKTGLVAVGILVAGLVLVRLILRVIDRGLKKSRIPQTLHAMLRAMLRLLLDLVVLLTAANYIGIPVTSFVTLLGLAGLAISLALQGVLSNLAGGFIILISHPFEVGHFIEHDGVIGTVREIRMQHTRLETPDGKMIYVPNSSVSAARVINYSETGKRRVEIPVAAAYGSTPEQVRAAVMDAIGKTKGILTDPEPVVFLEAYGDFAIQYILQVWVPGGDFLTIKRGLNEQLYSAFAEHGVEMTYPHLNVHMKEQQPIHVHTGGTWTESGAGSFQAGLSAEGESRRRSRVYEQPAQEEEQAAQAENP